MKHLLKIILLLLFGSGSLVSKAQSANDTTTSQTIEERLNEYLTSANNVYQFNGFVLIAQKGKILLQKGFGYRNAINKTLNQSNTIFPILSMTKSFTATLILKLQEQGKISVNDRISKFFPDYKYGNKITIKELLNHTSGIPNYTDIIGPEDSDIVCNPVSRQRVLVQFYNKPLDSKPGKKFSYSNSGYFLLGLIIEKLTGKTYEQVVREEIFKPLQMNHSGFDFAHLPDSVKATGYWVWNAESKIYACPWDSTVTYSAGEIYSTTSDLYQWAKAVAAKQILSEESWKQAFTPYLENYGLGWFVDSMYSKPYVAHSGGGFGYMSYLLYFPDEDVTIILLNNFGNYGQNLIQITRGLAAIVFEKQYKNWITFKEVAVDDSILKRYVGVYSLDKKIKVSVTIKDDQLYAEGNSSHSIPKLPIYPMSKNEFFLKDFNVVMEFVNDANGKIIKLVAHESGRDEVMMKTE